MIIAGESSGRAATEDLLVINKIRLLILNNSLSFSAPCRHVSVDGARANTFVVALRGRQHALVLTLMSVLSVTAVISLLNSTQFSLQFTDISNAEGRTWTLQSPNHIKCTRTHTHH